jgi:hypothetical protein
MVIMPIYKLSNINKSRDSSVSIVTRLRAKPYTRLSIRLKYRLFSFPKL